MPSPPELLLYLPNRRSLSVNTATFRGQGNTHLLTHPNGPAPAPPSRRPPDPEIDVITIWLLEGCNFGSLYLLSLLRFDPSFPVSVISTVRRGQPGAPPPGVARSIEKADISADLLDPEVTELTSSLSFVRPSASSSSRRYALLGWLLLPGGRPRRLPWPSVPCRAWIAASSLLRSYLSCWTISLTLMAES